MLIRVSGGRSGITEYLIRGRKAGREYSREELDQRVQLHGSTEQLDSILDSFDQDEKHQKYFHITLSFKESEISDTQLREIDQQFSDFIFTACADDEFYYYSEAHLPRIKQLPDKNGHNYDRFPHIHVVIPEYNLYTGERDNPLSRISNITKYIDAFQERINERYGLASPKDNIRELSVGRAEIINRYELRPDMSRQEIKKTVFDLVRRNPDIRSVDELAVVLKPLGQVRVRDSKKFGAKYINLSFDNSGKRKAVNLKDTVFLDEYLATRDPSVSRSFSVPEQDKLLDDWRQFAALEARFVEKASAKDRENYWNIDQGGRQTWLNERWQQHIASLSLDIGIDERDKTQHKPLPLVMLRDYDAIPHLDEMLHIDDMQHIDDINYYEDIYEQYEQWAGQQPGCAKDEARGNEHRVHGMRACGDHGNHGARELASTQNLLSTNSRDDVDRNAEVGHSDVFIVRAAGRLSAVEQYGDQVTARHEKKLASWTDKINAVDCRTLLNYLSYHYHLDVDQLGIERSKKGGDRIVVNGRCYSAADYLTKEMHLSWLESKQILETILEQQEKGEKQRDQAVTSRIMWHRFQRYESELPGLASVHANYRQRKADIRQRLSFEHDSTQSKAQNSVRRRLLAQQQRAEIEQAREQWLDEQQYYQRRPHERYLSFLQHEAQNGSDAALGELRRVYPQDRDDSCDQQSCCTIQIRDPNRMRLRFAPFDLGYTVRIVQNGIVEYRDKEQHTVISDRYDAIRVHDLRAETIAKALEMAKARYGTDNLEIRNATPENLQVIQEAVNKTKTEVTIISEQQKLSIER